MMCKQTLAGWVHVDTAESEHAAPALHCVLPPDLRPVPIGRLSGDW